jgi:apoptotic chromatin condensation inducer in the nucleus
LERKVSVEYKSDSSERPSYEKQSSVSSVTQDSEDNSNIIAFNRKISIVDDTASKLKPPPSPAKNPTSNILYITNLVRPFTLKQLKELLERTGKIQEEGFWTDRIKSKCYVQYETQE